MGDPTPGQLAVAIQSLRDDATVWSDASHDLAAARAAGMFLNLHEFHFSYIGDQVGLTRVYAELKEKITRLLDEGAMELKGLSQAIRTAADEYESDDERTYRRIHDVY